MYLYVIRQTLGHPSIDSSCSPYSLHIKYILVQVHYTVQVYMHNTFKVLSLLCGACVLPGPGMPHTVLLEWRAAVVTQHLLMQCPYLGAGESRELPPELPTTPTVCPLLLLHASYTRVSPLSSVINAYIFWAISVRESTSKWNAYLFSLHF